MKHYEQQEEVIARSKFVLDHVTCDLCGEEIKTDGCNWEYNEPTISIKYRRVFPEIDGRITYEIDFCEDCFEAKVQPAIEALGTKFRVEI